MTFALALVFAGLLLMYCGIKGRSLRHAIVGRSVAGGSGSLIGS